VVGSVDGMLLSDDMHHQKFKLTAQAKLSEHAQLVVGAARALHVSSAKRELDSRRSYSYVLIPTSVLTISRGVTGRPEAPPAWAWIQRNHSALLPPIASCSSKPAGSLARTSFPAEKIRSKG